MRLQYTEFTHPGGRTLNQDYFCHVLGNDWAFFALADGLGGHDRGELASQYLLETLAILAGKYNRDILHFPCVGMKAFIQEGVENFRTRVQKEGISPDLHTTLACIWINDNHLISAHAGDSRIYRFLNDRIIWRSPDHTMVQKCLEEGKITEEDMASHPLQHHLLNTVNIFEPPHPDINVHPPLGQNEMLLLCTDGFWTHFTDAQKLALMREKSLESKLKAMVQTLTKNVLDVDNITLQVIKKI